MEIIFPKQVIKTLKDVYGIEEAEALSEIDFATTAVDTITGKRTFKIIFYEVEDSDSSFEIYIYNKEYFIEYLGEETQYNFIAPYNFDESTVDTFGDINEIII